MESDTNCACIRGDTISFQASVYILIRVSSKHWKQGVNWKIFFYLKNRELEDSTVVSLKIGLIIMQFGPKTSFYGIDEMASNMTEP